MKNIWLRQESLLHRVAERSNASMAHNLLFWPCAVIIGQIGCFAKRSNFAGLMKYIHEQGY